MEVEDGDWRAAVMRMTPKSGSDAEDMCIGEARADTLGDVKGDVRLVDRAWWDLKICTIPHRVPHTISMEEKKRVEESP